MSDDLLPSNATPQERALAATTVRLTDVPTPVRDVWNADTCPPDLLPWLAWALSVDTWDTSWSETQKREVIKAAIPVQQHKGTIGALRDAISAIGLEMEVLEWFRKAPMGDPYTFSLSIGVDQVGLTADGLAKLLDIVKTSKNLRSWLDGLLLTIKSQSTVYVGGVSSIGTEITLQYDGDRLKLDGSWKLNGAQKINGIKAP